MNEATSEKEQASTGAVRSKLYPQGAKFPARYDLMMRNTVGMRRLAETWGEGEMKYGSKKRPIILVDAIRQLDKACTCGNTSKQRNATPIAGTPDEGCASNATQPNIQKRLGQPVILTGSPSETANVASVTTGCLNSEIQNTPSDKSETTPNGPKATNPETQRIKASGSQGTQPRSEWRDSHPMDSIQKTSHPCCNFKGEGVEYAAASQVIPDSTSTTTRKQERCEGSFAGDATEGSECLETILRLLNEHTDTCYTRQQLRFSSIEGILHVEDLLPNWMHGFPESVFISHIMDHLRLYLAGDTSEDHMAHLAWNALALCWVEENKPELLDLTKPTQKL